MLLLTGHSGFLGSILQDAFSPHFLIYSLGRSISSQIQADLSKEPPPLLQHYEWVIHNAGKAHSVPRTPAEEQLFFETNVTGTLNLLQALEKVGPPERFIFISSVAVYGLEAGEDISESFPLNGASPYALSKIQAEDAVGDWCARNNVEAFIFRLPLVVGPDAPGNLGGMRRAIQRGYYLKIRENSARKSVVLASDIAELIVHLPSQPGVYNLTDGIHPSIADLEKALEQATGKSIRLSISRGTARLLAKTGDLGAQFGLPSPVTSPKLEKLLSTLTFNDDLARQLLNWNPRPAAPELASMAS
jgi:nucleoside-diphosphate-sugar epimerase